VRILESNDARDDETPDTPALAITFQAFQENS
jgi:hypothetical protein